MIAYALFGLGHAACLKSDYSSAYCRYEEAVVLMREVGDTDL